MCSDLDCFNGRNRIIYRKDFYIADAFLFYPHIKTITGFFYTLLISSLRFEKTSGLGQKCSNRKKCSNWKCMRGRKIGAKVVKQGEMLQPERVENQADWG